MPGILVPKHYDYIAVYLTDRCPLRCSYCITEHNDTKFISGSNATPLLAPEAWAKALNNLDLPNGVPITLQGGEPLVYPGIWELLEQIQHPIDILTALPRNASLKHWLKLSAATLAKLNRNAPYPNIRVSYHVGQNNIEDLVLRVRELEPIVSIGIYAVDHPEHAEAIAFAKSLCEKNNVFFKTKEFLGFYNNKLYGKYLYPEAVSGRLQNKNVVCKNSVLILGPDGLAYRCHSDLYHKRKNLALGQITDSNFIIRDQFTPCKSFGLCSECDVKIKNNHEQKFGYTSVQIKMDLALENAEQ
jgi:organic radical activating enzyme